MLPVGRATSSFAYGLVSDWLNECYLLVMGLTVPKVTSKAVDRHFFSRMLLGICCLIIKHNKCGLFKLLLVKTDDSERSWHKTVYACKHYSQFSVWSSSSLQFFVTICTSFKLVALFKRNSDSFWATGCSLLIFYVSLFVLLSTLRFSKWRLDAALTKLEQFGHYRWRLPYFVLTFLHACLFRFFW